MGEAKRRRDRAPASGQQWEISWVDRGFEPQHPPNPAYPNGVDCDLSGGGPYCETPLPYPAARCGDYVVRCNRCSWLGIVSTAGRTDDPRSLKVPCRLKRH